MATKQLLPRPLRRNKRNKRLRQELLRHYIDLPLPTKAVLVILSILNALNANPMSYLLVLGPERPEVAERRLSRPTNTKGIAKICSTPSPLLKFLTKPDTTAIRREVEVLTFGRGNSSAVDHKKCLPLLTHCNLVHGQTTPRHQWAQNVP